MQLERKSISFSVIIPARNEELNLPRCLRSIAAVDWPAADVETVVVDNGSTDRTAELARAHGAQVFSRPGETVSALRNFGAARSRGRILVFLDADCSVPVDWLRQAARYLDDDEVACFGSPPVLPSKSTWVQRSWYPVRRKRGVGETEWLESMNMFVRREAFDRAGGFNPSLVTCEDYDLSVRLRKVGRIMTDERIVAVHHGEAATVAHFFRKEHWRALGNLHGVRCHPWQWRELPSVALPVVYCLFPFLLVGVFFAAPLPEWLGLCGALLLLWQVPLWLLAIWKNRDWSSMTAATQLYVLLNVYFAARGLATFRRKP